MSEYPALCPKCGCPIQLLIKPGTTWGETEGTIEDALNKHADVVHPDQRP